MIETKQEDRIVSSVDIAKELSQHEPQKSFNTGFYHLDKMLNGVKEGDLIILSGLTGNGKTELAVSLAKKFIDQQLNVLFFSYEISAQELLERFGTPVPLFYLPRLNTSGATAWLEKKIIEAKELYDTKVVFIDHLHYLVDFITTRTKNTSEMLGYMCREFKFMARKHKIVIVLIAHVRKFDSSRPTMMDVKDSSGITQEADTVMIIHRTGKKRSKKSAQRLDGFEDEEAYEVDNKATLYLDKVRRRGGKLGKVDLQFNGKEYEEA